ncbi:putative quinol monooxygenase [Planotetraspora kaengkrachanensis]|nr:antibiotic biosynthesis monooxygenase [Planotetraspora kaengkrachanensis]
MGSTMGVLVAFLALAGALTAGMTTAVLIGRLREEPTGWLIAWSVATGALTLSLATIGLGQLAGFGAAIFRISQITGSLLAPLWLAIGLLQLLADKGSSRFGGWLIGSALTVVGAVIMLLDPVAGTFSKDFPDAAAHWDIWPEYLLHGVHGLVIVMLLISLAVALLSWRDGDDYDIDNMQATVVLAPAGMLLSGALALGLPSILVVILMAASAGGVWYAVSRPLAPYEEDDEEDHESEEWSGRSRRSADRHEPQAAPPIPPAPHRSGLGDLVAEYQAKEEAELDFANRMQPMDDFGRPRPDEFANRMQPADDFGLRPRPDEFAGPETGQLIMPDAYAQPRQADFGAPVTPPAEAPHDMPATGVMFPVVDNPAFPPAAAAAFGSAFGAAAGGGVSASRADSSVKPAAGIYGILTVFTLMDGSGEAFDKLAEETVEAVLRNEPDTLVFICHAVKSAPLQRIVYELYRDEVGFSEHQRQPHMERFATERQSLVLATNVIELTLNAAKVVPLPGSAYRV